MTNPVAKTGPKHVVVDGSNVATEGRTSPSLKQLNEAVLSFMNEFPNTKITVVVDATFGHRIDKREVAEFNSAINNNELVAPPAGAVGRGDGFVIASGFTHRSNSAAVTWPLATAASRSDRASGPPSAASSRPAATSARARLPWW